MKKVICALFLLGVLGGFCHEVQAGDDVQNWQRYLLRLAKVESVSFNLYAEGWLRDDMKRFELFLISPQIKWTATKNLNIQLNYTFLGSRSGARDDFAQQHRAEIEINPHWEIGDWLKVLTRNRMEFRWIEDQGSYNPRMRNRLRLVFPISDMGMLKSFFVDTEFFYLLDKDLHNEQRTTPFGLNFALNESVNFQAFYMIQNQKTDTWKSNQIIGTMLTVQF